MLGQDRSW